MITVCFRVALAVVLGSIGAGASQPTPIDGRSSEQRQTAAASNDGLSVAELDLSGIDQRSVRELPPVAPLPENATTPVASAQVTIDEAAPASWAGTRATFAEFRTSSTDVPQNLVPDPDVLTAEIATAPFSVVGVTWAITQGVDGVVIRYRVRQCGTWTSWEAVSASDAAPDAASQESQRSAARGATDPIVALDSTGI